VLDALATRWLLGRADRAIAITEWIADAWRRGGAPRGLPIDIVTNGIELPDVPVARVLGTTIGVACRLSDSKGLEELLALLPALKARLPGLAICIAGDGPRRARYEAQAAETGVPVSFLGFVSDLEAFWRSVDLSIFSAPFEPFGLRLIEPVAYGVPVAAYRNGTGSDEVIDRCRGIAAVPYGDVVGLADLVADILSNSDRRRRMAVEGREDVAQHFTVAAMARGVDATYARIERA
jgi:glycosyltransferase involved in cell wall biosynthesis